MSSLRVRAYNVLFGDAILVSVPDADESGAERTRHILFDVGNVLVGRGGKNEVFVPIFDDIEEELQGQPLDLYVMTHEHLDHVQGLPYMAEEYGRELPVRHAWLTASARPGYYEMPGHEETRKKRLEAEETYVAAATFLSAQGAAPRHLQALLEANDFRSTSKCVKYLQEVAGDVSYVYRGWDPADHHPFRDTTLTVWAPEENTAIYYGHFRPMQVALSSPDRKGRRRSIAATPPTGVDLGAFIDLVESRRRHVDSVLAIDRASNNTSVVLCIEWRGWRLLFPGDAEHRSWREMGRHEGLIGPVHVLKVGHHGSHNATPPPEILDRILPPAATDRHSRYAVLSTRTDVYRGVPHDGTLDVLAGRVDVRRTDSVEAGKYIDLVIEG